MDWTGIERNEKGDKQIKLSKITNYDREINTNWRKRRERNGLEQKGIKMNRMEKNKIESYGQDMRKGK